MTKGLIHAHQGLAYLLVLSTSLSLLIAVLNGALGSKPGLVKLGTVLGRKVEPALMGIVGLLGLGSWVAAGLPVTTPYLWVGVAAVVGQSVVAVKGTKPTLIQLAAGDAGVRWRWPVSALASALIVWGIFGLMQAF